MYGKLTETDQYRDLRILLQQGANINRDQIFHSQTSYNIIDKAYSKKGIDPVEEIPTYGIASPWCDRISFEYIKLDMHGYQEDQVKVTTAEI